MTMTLIETKTLPSAAASIEFTSIPQDFTDLLVLCAARSNQSGAFDNSTFLINGSGGSMRRLLGVGSSASSSSDANLTLEWTAASATADVFGSYSIYIPNYTSAVAKSISVDGVTENNATSAAAFILAGLSTSTAAVTTILFDAPGGAGTFLTGSIFSLYGILKGSDGIVTTS
jgi:hypothetical protein